MPRWFATISGAAALRVTAGCLVSQLIQALGLGTYVASNRGRAHNISLQRP